MARDCVPKALSRMFYIYGHFVARYPWPFLLLPLVIGMVFSSGTFTMNPTIDVEYLYVPANAPSLTERATIEADFPSDDTNTFTPLRQLRNDGFLQFIIQSCRTDNNVFTDEVIREAIRFDNNMRAQSVGEDGVTFTDVCASWQGQCHRDIFLDFMNNTSVHNVNMTFPIFRTSSTLLQLSNTLARVRVNNNGLIEYASAILLSYDVKYQINSDRDASNQWLNSMRDSLLEFESDVIKIEFQTSLTLAQILEEAVERVLPMFIVTFGLMSAFAFCTSLTGDWTRGKPLVAFAGELAAALGAGSSLGLLSFLGVPFASAVGIMPFLIIGIGLDDMYILVSAWRYTCTLLPVEERLALTLQNAAVSITITSVTDALAFGIGCLTPFRSVQIFCAYTGLAVVFVYVYMVTFTAAIMVYAGWQERHNKHCLTGKLILPSSEITDSRSRLYDWFCTGGNARRADPDIIQQCSISEQPVVKYVYVIPAEEQNASGVSKSIEDSNPEAASSSSLKSSSEQNADSSRSSKNSSQEDSIEGQHDEIIQQNHLEVRKIPLVNRWLEVHFAPFLVTTHAKIMCGIVYAAYIAATVYGLTILKEGLNPSNLAPDGTYFARHIDLLRSEFSQHYGPYISCIFNQTLDYTSTEVNTEIERSLQVFKDSEYFFDEPEQMISWLREYKAYLTMTMRDYGTLSEQQFAHILRTEFLTIPAFAQFSMDIRFSADNSSIAASRMFVRARGLTDSNAELNMMNAARDSASQSQYTIRVFCALFTYFDQYAVVLGTTLQNLGVAVGSMLIVAALLIPSITTVVCVTATTILICAGVMGFMALWDVSLDSVSMINLIMCIGFSVDFSAHISYHFASSTGTNALERCKDTLGQLGAPVLQAAVSTIIAIVVLAFSDSYIFRTFFKIVFLVMVFGFFHALFILPIVLSIVIRRGRTCPQLDDAHAQSKTNGDISTDAIDHVVQQSNTEQN